MKYKDTCQTIIDNVGGKSNIRNVTHCATRLRLTLNDKSKTNAEAIKRDSEVVEVISNGVAFQIVMGTHVDKVYEDFMTLYGGENKSSEAPKEKKNIFQLIFGYIAETVSPLISPILAAGLIAAVLSLLTLLGIVDPESPTYMVIDTIRSSVFYFLPFLLAFSSAKQLNVNPYIAAILAAALLSPSINGVEGLSIFGISLPTITYSNSFMPIMLGVWFMSLVDKATYKIIPKKYHSFFQPVIALLISVPATLLIFGPIGTYISVGLEFVINWVSNNIGLWFAVGLYAASQPFLNLIGAKNFVIPIIMNNLTTMGYDPLIVPAASISDVAVAGAVLGLIFKAKTQEEKQLFSTTGISALLGITEPAVYGVFAKYRRPFFAVIFGGGIAGILGGILGMKAYALVGLVGITSYLGDGDYRNFYVTIICFVIAFILAFLFSLFFGWSKKKNNEADSTSDNGSSEVNRKPVIAPAVGTVIPLAEVKDAAFSSGALGMGMGIIPTDSKIKSPVDGTIIHVQDTGHAYGIKTSYGAELLIHLGIDTAKLGGEGFVSHIKEGDTVKTGQLIAEMNLELLRGQGFDPTVITVVTNTEDYLSVLPTTEPKTDEHLEVLNIII